MILGEAAKRRPDQGQGEGNAEEVAFGFNVGDVAEHPLDRHIVGKGIEISVAGPLPFGAALKPIPGLWRNQPLGAPARFAERRDRGRDIDGRFGFLAPTHWDGSVAVALICSVRSNR